MDTKNWQFPWKAEVKRCILIYEKIFPPHWDSVFVAFLGLLHLEVIQERLEREYDLSLILTAPSVQYQVIMNDDSILTIDNPALYPNPVMIQSTKEPFIRASISFRIVTWGRP
jgi:GTP-binding protein LepA